MEVQLGRSFLFWVVDFHPWRSWALPLDIGQLVHLSSLVSLELLYAHFMAANAPLAKSLSTFSFYLSPPYGASRFGPRLGRATLKRTDGSPAIELDTPGLLATTSRGVIPHLSRDHHRLTKAIRWVHVPFETLYVAFVRPFTSDGVSK
jgi:hypothetical protein